MSATLKNNLALTTAHVQKKNIKNEKHGNGKETFISIGRIQPDAKKTQNNRKKNKEETDLASAAETKKGRTIINKKRKGRKKEEERKGKYGLY